MKKNLSVDEAKDILKNIVLNAHKKASHKNIGSRIMSIVGFQKTSIGMFLEYFHDGFKAVVQKNKRDHKYK